MGNMHDSASEVQERTKDFERILRHEGFTRPEMKDVGGML